MTHIKYEQLLIIACLFIFDWYLLSIYVTEREENYLSQPS